MRPTPHPPPRGQTAVQGQNPLKIFPSQVCSRVTNSPLGSSMKVNLLYSPTGVMGLHHLPNRGPRNRHVEVDEAGLAADR